MDSELIDFSFRWLPPGSNTEECVDFTEAEVRFLASELDDLRQALSSKAARSVTALALVAYVDDLLCDFEDDPESAPTALLAEAAAAMWKAYALHHLPIYVFETASIHDLMGDAGKAEPLYRLFLEVQSTHSPDIVDRLTLEERGFDMERVVALVRRRLHQESDSGNERQREGSHRGDADSR